jgi:thiosulfate/3-mercaptopyruvate sulfurtransferase
MHTTLVSAAMLAGKLDDSGWIVLDCRHDLANAVAGLQAWQAGHIPQARFISVDTDLSDKKIGPNDVFRGRHPLPPREIFIQRLREWGINDDTQVIAYDAQGGMFAARLWWMLRWIGHRAVALLDGGWQTWQAGGYPVSTALPDLPRGTASLRPPLVTTVEAADLLANLDGATQTIVDARSPERYRGENETMDPVGGHIPGALNRFYRDNLQEDGSFKPAEQLKREWNAIIDSPQSAVMQCGSGITACHNLLALEIAGLQGAALYPGSWSEWCSDPTRPVARGA